MPAADFEPIRTLGFASISATYATVGPVTTHLVRGVCISNNTAGDMYFTRDNTQNVTLRGQKTIITKIYFYCEFVYSIFYFFLPTTKKSCLTRLFLSNI